MFQVAQTVIQAVKTRRRAGDHLAGGRAGLIDAKLIANHAAWADDWKREKIETLAMLLKGALEAGGQVGLKMNVPKAKLEEVSQQLSSLHTPTISSQTDPEWVALEVIIDEHIVRDLIPELKKAGAEGIIEYPLNKVIY